MQLFVQKAFIQKAFIPKNICSKKYLLRRWRRPKNRFSALSGLRQPTPIHPFTHSPIHPFTHSP
ncbi:hypothetical protein, partial [Dickeya dianthicola]|uniref:hypothetical protein n=3 Tax=Dickeya dianthicola TaxID=204039 RepID=UPI001E4B0E8A